MARQTRPAPPPALIDRPEWHYEALTCAIGGMTRRQIADRFGVALSTTQEAIEGLLLAGHAAPAVQRELWNQRIEMSVRALMPKVVKGDLAAVSKLVELIRVSSEINGLKVAVAQAHLYGGEVVIRFENQLGEAMEAPFVLDNPAP